MKNGKGKLLSLLLAAVMVISLMPMSVFALAKENDNVKKVQLTLTDNSTIDIVEDKNVHSSEGILSEGGKYSYNSDTSTLTLTDANLYKIHVQADNFTIKFAGNNTITSKKDEWPIELDNTFTQDVPGNTTIDIENNAILNVNGKASVHPIITAHTNLTINNKGKFISDGSNGHIISSKEGLKLYGGNYNINNNGTPIIYGLKDILIQNVNLVAKGINGNFIDSDKNLTIIGGKYILETNKYNAIYSREDIVISGASLTATTNDKEANAIAGKKIVISDNASVVAKTPNSKSWPALFGDNEITITNSQVTAESAGDVGIFSKGTVSITNRSNVDATGYWSAIRGNTGVMISDSEVDAKSSDDAGIFSPDTVSITKGSNVDATGKWPAIRGDTGVIISDSEVGAKSKEDVAIYTKSGNITLNQAKLIAKSLPGYENTLYAPDGSITIDGYVKDPDEIHADYITPADYTKLDEAIASVADYNKNAYTADTWAAVETAFAAGNAVDRNKSYKEQKVVDDAAAAIVDALAKLQRKPVSSSITAAEFKDGVATVTSNGRPKKIQIIDEAGSTRTYNRSHEAVTIVGYDANGKVVNSLDRALAYEVWTINTTAPAGQNLEAKAKINMKWEDETFAFVGTVTPPVYNDAYASHSVAYDNPDYNLVNPGKFSVAVVTGPDARKVQIVAEDGSTSTYSVNSSVVGEDGNRTFNCTPYASKDLRQAFTIRVKGADNVWEDADTFVIYTEKVE